MQGVPLQALQAGMLRVPGQQEGQGGGQLAVLAQGMEQEDEEEEEEGMKEGRKAMQEVPLQALQERGLRVQGWQEGPRGRQRAVLAPWKRNGRRRR